MVRLRYIFDSCDAGGRCSYCHPQTDAAAKAIAGSYPLAGGGNGRGERFISRDRGGWPALVYLVFITVFIAGILGTAISLVAGIIAAMVQRSLLKGAQLGLNMVLGSLIAAVIAFAIGCRVASPGIFVEMANPETAGDGMLGITYSGLVLILAVLPATVIGAMMGGMLNYKPRH
ncbi:MAG: hypothetical protein AAF215_01305 [Cyanobacteria bacterium P01_A01_bin.123]